MKRKNLVWSGFALITSLIFLFAAAAPANLLNRWRSVVRAASLAPVTKEDFDIRAGLQRTLNDPAEAEITIPLAPPSTGERAQQRRSELPYALRRAHPSLQMKWSTLTQAPSRLWSWQETLSAPSADDAEIIARRFLNNNADLLRLDQDDVAALQVSRRYQDAHNGLTHLWLQQQIDGIEVFQGDLAVHLARTGEIVALSGEALPNVAELANARKPHLNAVAALRLAAADADAELKDNVTLKAQPNGADQKQVFDRASGFDRDVEAKLVYFPLAHNQVRLAWQFTLWMQETPDVYLTLIDAEKGSVLFRYNLTSYDENPLKPHGEVFTKDAPRFSMPLSTTNPPLLLREDVPFRATPYQNTEIFPVSDPHYDWWAGRPANNLISNNTSTYLDRDANNQPDTPRLEAATGVFTFPLDFTKQPTDPDYQKAAQANLFYWINRYHDILYSFGFTEAAGNFQTDNFGRGGRGADAVLGEAQDGSSTNNANFSTPTDGSPGRVQMFLWTTNNPQLDGDFDTGVVIHELTHGTSTRLVGGGLALSGVQAGGMGEGWSDYFALTLLRSEQDDPNGTYPMGQYVTNNYATGIRRYPYSTSTNVSPLTYKDVALRVQVHAIGEIWCNGLWEMRAQLIQRYGFKEGQRQSLQLVVDGMKLTPRAPSLIDARNGILLADRVNNNGANQCLIWGAFAKRGVGFFAETTDSSDGAPIESRETAPFCNAFGSLRTDKGIYVAGETLRLNLGDANATGTLTVRATTSATGDSETLTMVADRNTPGSFNATLNLASGRANPDDGVLQGSVEAGDQIILLYNDVNNGPGGSAVQVRATSAFAREKVSFDDTVEAGNQGWLPTGTWAITNARAASPTRSWTDSPAGAYVNGANFALTSPLLDLSGLSDVTFTFAQSYDVEQGFDFGLVEFSTDDGQTWRRAAAATGTQLNFQQAQVRLRGLDNQPRARIRLRLTADTVVTGDGWYVDDLRVTGRSVSPAVIAPGTSLQPALASLAPAFGVPAGGTRVTLYGTNFTENDNTVVTFDGVPATNVTVVSPFVMTVVAPAHAAATVNVRVANRNGAVTLGNAFTYFSTGGTARQPEIESLFPTFGSTRGGTLVTVLGKNFTPDSRVSFDQRAATTTFVNPTTLRAVSTVAPNAGRADVLVTTGTLSHNLPGGFNYINPTPPTVDVISPDGGEALIAGSVVSIRWNSADNRALASHRVSLFRPGTIGLQFVRDLAVNLPGNARNYNWTVPFDLAVTDYRIRVIATDDEGSETEAYSNGGFTLTRRWETARPLPTPLALAATAGDGRYLYTIGGRALITGTPTVTTVQRLDTQGNTPWAEVAPLPAGLSTNKAVFVRGKIYVVGGANASLAITNAHYAYDVAANTWATAAVLPLPVSSYAIAGDEANGAYYVTGGNTGPSAAAQVQAYNIATNTWSQLPQLNVFRAFHEAALIDGKLYVTGGINPAGVALETEVYDFSTRRWTVVANMLRPRSNATSFVTRDPAGNPLWILVGGIDPNTGVLLGPEAFDVRRNRWLLLDNSFNLPTQRSTPSGAQVGNFFYAIASNSSLTGTVNERIQSNVLSIVPFNSTPPVLVAPETVVAIAGIETQFEVLANDLSSDAPLTLNATGLPSGARFEVVNSTNNSTRGAFRWTPTAADAGRSLTITVSAGDGLDSETRQVNLRVVTARPLAAVNAADFRAGGLAPDSLASLFGTELAQRSELASELPWPLELGGTTVTINGVRAPLVFVSPGQINFVVPANVTPGSATIVVSTATGVYSAATVPIIPTAPALFTKDFSGKGEANAVATADGIRFQTAPFDVLINGRPNILVLFGTGLRRAAGANPNDENGVAEAVTATIGGQPARVLFAGPQGSFSGLDQINVELPAALAGGGRRSVEIVLSVNGENANRVTIELR